MTPITEEVKQRIRVLFPESRWPEVERMLEERCGTDLPLVTHLGTDPARFDRIRLAVLKLSGGSLERLGREIDEAHVDWRDTLVAAGFGDDVDAHKRWMPEPRQ